MGKDIRNLHTFVVCAYGESPYLTRCLDSLEKQHWRSNVILAAAQDSEFLRRTAENYGVELRIRGGEPEIAADWNFALAQADTELVTLAHQDDIYTEDYSRAVARAYAKSRRPLLIFTDYNELRETAGTAGAPKGAGNVGSAGAQKGSAEVGSAGTQNGGENNRDAQPAEKVGAAARSGAAAPRFRVVRDNRLLRVKRLMLAPLRFPGCAESRFVRRRILSMGSAICCPAVTLVKARLPEGRGLFRGNMKSNIDWQAWEELSRQQGSFVYIPRALMLHRVHSASTTNRLLEAEKRKEEDLYMFRKFWPEGIARLIEHFYQTNERVSRV